MRDLIRLGIFVAITAVCYVVLVAISFRNPMIDQRRFLKLRK